MSLDIMAANLQRLLSKKSRGFDQPRVLVDEDGMFIVGVGKRGKSALQAVEYLGSIQQEGDYSVYQYKVEGSILRHRVSILRDCAVAIWREFLGAYYHTKRRIRMQMSHWKRG